MPSKTNAVNVCMWLWRIRKTNSRNWVTTDGNFNENLTQRQVTVNIEHRISALIRLNICKNI